MRGDSETLGHNLAGRRRTVDAVERTLPQSATNTITHHALTERGLCALDLRFHDGLIRDFDLFQLEFGDARNDALAITHRGGASACERQENGNSGQRAITHGATTTLGDRVGG